MESLAGAAEALERTVSGVVRIACPPDVAEVVVAPLLPGLISKHRGLRIEIAPGETVLDLTRHEADIALRTVRPVRGDLVVTRLSTVRWVPVAAPTLACALGRWIRGRTHPGWVGESVSPASRRRAGSPRMRERWNRWCDPTA